MKFCDVEKYKCQWYSVFMTACYIIDYAVSEFCLSFFLLKGEQCFRHRISLRPQT